ncbi:MAG: recombination protein RecO [Campylobacterota bacterium]|nr:recombination protein RecO [Campylobacterota bacterium]
MQGFIIKISRYKDEDLIVTILTSEKLKTVYRFYGARHSVINLGYKIDFESEKSIKSNIPRLKEVIHLGYKWMLEHKYLRYWQQFCALFFQHLNDTHELDSFYFNLLNNSATIWDKQNPKRVAIESYVKLLEHEGRLHVEHYCMLCEEKIDEDISLIRAFLPTHYNCSHTLSINKKALNELYKNHSTIFLTDKEIDRMWIILLEGL